MSILGHTPNHNGLGGPAAYHSIVHMLEPLVIHKQWVVTNNGNNGPSQTMHHHKQWAAFQTTLPRAWPSIYF